jgi:Leucine-rich repeat (LRR) protein
MTFPQLFVAIQVLTISDNPLVEPPTAVVNGQGGSKLAYNYMRSLFDSMSSHVLMMESLGIAEIPAPALALEEMHAMYLSRNSIASIPEDIGNMINLRELHMSHNMLHKLPESFGMLSALRTLILASNQLQKMDAILLQLTDLRTLDLSHNRITSIPAGVSSFASMLSLYISGNPIAVLPASMGFMTSLTDLRFEGTKIRKVPLSLGSLTSLRCLRMDAAEMEEPRSEICMAGMQVVVDYMRKFDHAYETLSLDVQSWGITHFPTELLSYRRPTDNRSLGPHVTCLNLSRNLISQLPESFALLEALTDLDISENALTRIPGAVCWLTGLRRLNVQYNYHLRRLPIEMCGMQGLEALMVTSSRILAPPVEMVTKAQPNDFGYCKIGVVEYCQRLDEARKRGTISLSRMGLRRFPPEVITAIGLYWDFNEVRGSFITGRGKLDVLTEIRLDHNNLQVLPACIGQLTRVRIFDLSANLLRAVPTSVGNMSALEILNLSKNRLTVVNDAIGYLTNLVKLQLHANLLAHLTEAVSSLYSLLELSLSYNRLTALPACIPRITSLKNLLVTNNDLCTDPSNWGVPGLSHELASMPNLIEINVDGNEQLQVPPRDMWKGPSSKVLEFLRLLREARDTHSIRMHDMGLRSLPDVIMRMSSVTMLSLNDNTLRSLPDKIAQMTNLTLLELDRNDLVQLPEEATKISNLIELRCSYNQLRSLPESCNRWIRVERIIATDNKIKHIPEGLCEMPNLTELDLDRNRLKDLPEAFTLCTSLTRLRFDTQDMVKASPAHDLPEGIRRCEVPAEIAICGVDAIIEHFFKMHRAWTTCSLDLKGFGLRNVMDDVCALTVLTYLNLSGNRLRFLPSPFTQLMDLRSLVLDDCYQLEYFHHHLHVMTRLKKISISTGVLENKHYPAIKMKWPPTIVAREPSLMRAYLSELNGCVGHHFTEKGIPHWITTNRLDYRFVPHDPILDQVTAGEIESDARRAFPSFPPEIHAMELTSLTHLQLPGGHITPDMMTAMLPFIPQLKKLILIDQQIDYIPEVITVLKALQVLTLTGNPIKELPPYLFTLTTLRKLVFVECRISKISPEIGNLTNLEDLVLTYNRLSAVPKEIGYLHKLDYLVLDENRIRVLPDTIQYLTSMRELSVSVHEPCIYYCSSVCMYVRVYTCVSV